MADKRRAGTVSLILVMLINVCLGTVYSWSVFRTPVEELFRVGSVASGFPYMTMLAFFSMTIPFSGRLVARFGVRRTALLGGALLGAGWMASSAAPGIVALTLTWGVLGGIGVGMTYVVPLTVAHAWFPHRRGAATGVALGGFGMSPFVTAPLAETAIVHLGIQTTFWVVGLAFATVVAGLGLLLRMPERSTAPSTDPNRTVSDAGPREMVRTPAFYALWISFLLASLVGLGAIAITAPWAQEVVGMSARSAAISVSLLATFNGIGRPVFGYLTDRIGLRATAIIAFLLIGTAAGGLLLGPQSSAALFIVAFAVFWLLLGGWLAIAPAATAALFGPAHYAVNYGIVFQAYGLGAVVGTLFSGELHDVFGSYRAVLLPIMGAAAIGLGIAWFAFPKRVQSSS